MFKKKKRKVRPEEKKKKKKLKILPLHPRVHTAKPGCFHFSQFLFVAGHWSLASQCHYYAVARSAAQRTCSREASGCERSGWQRMTLMAISRALLHTPGYRFELGTVTSTPLRSQQADYDTSSLLWLPKKKPASAAALLTATVEIRLVREGRDQII